MLTIRGVEVFPGDWLFVLSGLPCSLLGVIVDHHSRASLAPTGFCMSLENV
ncbi:hypothetical protein HNO86_29055 [Pseudomonas sp. C1C7]|uniref:hypothetical protein n=1 Tax=Pseudomonas sp. C1C7 TaxID=2735272 RepID=UPI001586E6D9|nr:hypothetical protein [Pseudomonas sp. C1C7]NUT79098.1 hypothetical protein [Pseudomonas sp. C1C7]